MASEWYYSRDGEDRGPVSSAELKSLAAKGLLRRTDLLWKEGMAEWKPAGDFSRLFPEGDTASVILEPEEPADENPFASLNLDIGRVGKKATTAKVSARATDPLASLKVKVATASNKATQSVKTHATVAGKVASLAAERAKISTVTLPMAYAELGEHCYRSRTHAEEFGELFAKLDAVQAGIAESGKPAEAGGDTITEKAKAWAEQGMKFAQSQAQGVQAKTLFVQLGKACFSRFGSEAGPEELVTRIEALRDRLSKLDAEVKTGVNKTGGAKGWLMYGGGALVCLMLISSCFSEKDLGGGGGGEVALDPIGDTTSGVAGDDEALKQLAANAFQACIVGMTPEEVQSTFRATAAKDRSKWGAFRKLTPSKTKGEKGDYNVNGYLKRVHWYGQSRPIECWYVMDELSGKWALTVAFIGDDRFRLRAKPNCKAYLFELTESGRPFQAIVQAPITGDPKKDNFGVLATEILFASLRTRATLVDDHLLVTCPP